MTKFDKNFNRIYMMLLAFVIVFSGFSFIGLNNANAQSINIIEIENEEAFLNIQNSPYISDKNTTFKLTKNLQFYGSEAFRGFGSREEPFKAKFNGQGFVLSGLNLQNTLFNYTEEADIRNLILHNCEFSEAFVKHASNTIFTNIGIYNYELNIYNRNLLVIKTPNNSESYFAYQSEECSFENIAVIYNLSNFISVSNEAVINNCIMAVSSYLNTPEITGLTVYENNQISQFDDYTYKLLFSENKIGSRISDEVNNGYGNNTKTNTDDTSSNNTDETNSSNEEDTEPSNTEEVNDNNNESNTELIEDTARGENHNGISPSGNTQISAESTFPKINQNSKLNITDTIFLIIFTVFGCIIIITPIIINIVKAIKNKRKNDKV